MAFLNNNQNPVHNSNPRLLPLLPLQIFKITRYISLQFYLSIKRSVTSDFLLVLVPYLYTLVYSFTYQLKGLSLIYVTSDPLLVLVPYLYTLYKFLGNKDVKLSFLYSDVIM